MTTERGRGRKGTNPFEHGILHEILFLKEETTRRNRE